MNVFFIKLFKVTIVKPQSQITSINALKVFTSYNFPNYHIKYTLYYFHFTDDKT